jgi:hypothetical protein
MVTLDEQRQCRTTVRSGLNSRSPSTLKRSDAAHLVLWRRCLWTVDHACYVTLSHQRYSGSGREVESVQRRIDLARGVATRLRVR